MKSCNGIMFLSGMAVLSIFVFFIVWSVVPFGGQTLPHLLEANWHWSFRFSAVLVSVLAAILGISALLAFASMAVRDAAVGNE